MKHLHLHSARARLIHHDQVAHVDWAKSAREDELARANAFFTPADLWKMVKNFMVFTLW